MPRIFSSSSGATTDAGDLTTGQVALARGGTNADLSATGGTGHVLKQASAGANITVGALAASDIASGTVDTARLGSGTADSTTFLRGDQTWATPSATDSTKLPLAGGTMTGAVSFSGSQTSPGASTVSAYRNSGGDFSINVASGDRFILTINDLERFTTEYNAGTARTYITSGSGSIIGFQATAGSAPFEIASTYCSFGIPILFAGGVVARWSTGGAYAQTHGASSTTNIIQESASTGFSALAANDPATVTNPAFKLHGLSHASSPGHAVLRSNGKSVAADDAWHDVLDLEGATYNSGTIDLWTDTGENVEFTITGTTIAIQAQKLGTAWVNSGSWDTSHKSLQVSAGKIQAKIGSGTAVTTCFAKLEGQVS